MSKLCSTEGAREGRRGPHRAGRSGRAAEPARPHRARGRSHRARACGSRSGWRSTPAPARSSGTSSPSRPAACPGADTKGDPVLRVVQWATGPLGRHALAAVVDHPDLEVVGVLVYSDEKAGRDAGEIVRHRRRSVSTATTDRDAILALDADCVVYMPQGETNPMGALDDICALLASGKNVVSTAVTRAHLPGEHGRRRWSTGSSRRAPRAARRFHATGIEPGWASEVLPLTMSGLFRYVDSLLVQELLDYSSYDNAFMLFDVMGFGRARGRRRARRRSDRPRRRLPGAADARRRRASARRSTTSSTTGRWRWPSEPFDVAAGPHRGRARSRRCGSRPPPSSTGGPRSPSSTSPGSAPDVAPDWPSGRGWKVTVEGRAVDGARGEDRRARRGRERPGLPRHGDARGPRRRAGVRGAARHRDVPRPADDHGPPRAASAGRQG